MDRHPPAARSSFRQILGAILSCCVLLVSVGISQAEVSRENFVFLEYGGFPEAHSTWGSIGFSAKHNKIFIGVTNHRDKVGLFEYDVASRQMRLRGFLPELAHLRDFQWQGKIHSRIWEAPDGAIYFSTDGGESREEYLMNHPHGYGGGFLMKWDPGSEQLTNLGYGLQFESIKDIAVDRIGGTIVGVSYPQGHLLRFSPEGQLVEDMGRVASDHIPRVLWSDWWGNIYYVDWRQRIVKWERSSGKLLFSEVSLPAFEGTPGEKIITGVTAFAEDQDAGVIYLITYGSMIIAFHPTETGIGEVQELGGLFDQPGREPYSYYCPNLGLGRNGKLYYFIGGHGNWAIEGEESVVLMEFDPQTREKEILLSFPVTEISEVTGHGVRDRDGNLYFCGRRHNPRAEQMGESGASTPFMIILNPEEAIQ